MDNRIYKMMSKEETFDCLKKFLYPIKDEMYCFYDAIKNDPYGKYDNEFEWGYVFHNTVKIDMTKICNQTIADVISYLQSLTSEQEKTILDFEIDADVIYAATRMPESEESYARRCYEMLNLMYENYVNFRKRYDEHVKKLNDYKTQLKNIKKKDFKNQAYKDECASKVKENIKQMNNEVKRLDKILKSYFNVSK